MNALHKNRSQASGRMGALLAMVPLALSAACSEARPQWVEAGDLGVEAESKKRTAELARDALARQLLSELTNAVAKGGPASGVTVCKQRAPAIAQAVGEKYGVCIGRTSRRLRNPANKPPSWAIASLPTDPPGPMFFEDARGRLGALFPIRLGAQCVMCHGQPDDISPEVRSALSKNYPSDTATGFEPGDHRGWFWVEVP